MRLRISNDRPPTAQLIVFNCTDGWVRSRYVLFNPIYCTMYTPLLNPDDLPLANRNAYADRDALAWSNGKRLSLDVCCEKYPSLLPVFSVITPNGSQVCQDEEHLPSLDVEGRQHGSALRTTGNLAEQQGNCPRSFGKADSR